MGVDRCLVLYGTYQEILVNIIKVEFMRGHDEVWCCVMTSTNHCAHQQSLRTHHAPTTSITHTHHTHTTLTTHISHHHTHIHHHTHTHNFITISLHSQPTPHYRNMLHHLHSIALSPHHSHLPHTRSTLPHALSTWITFSPNYGIIL